MKVELKLHTTDGVLIVWRRIREGAYQPVCVTTSACRAERELKKLREGPHGKGASMGLYMRVADAAVCSTADDQDPKTLIAILAGDV